MDNDSFPSAAASGPLLAPEVLADLASLDFSDRDLSAALTRIAEIAQRTITPAEEVSMTLVQGPRAYTAAFTGKTALDLDETQYDAGYGPCLDAAAGGQSFNIADMAAESRWPEFTQAAQQAGVRASLSISLPLQSGLAGALNMYGTKPHAFTAHDLALGRAFAGYAAVAVGNAHLMADAAAQARQMQEAMTHRAVIEQAKGIIMAERRCSPDEAFAVLRHLSNTSNRKLHDVAAMLVASAYPSGA